MQLHLNSQRRVSVSTYNPIACFVGKVRPWIAIRHDRHGAIGDVLVETAVDVCLKARGK